MWKIITNNGTIINSTWTDAARKAAHAAATRPPRRQDAWDREHIRTASTRLTLTDAARLQAATAAAGVSVYRLLQYMILEFLAAWEAPRRRKEEEEPWRH